MSKSFFVVRFQPQNGKNGGFGKAKTFTTSAKNSGDAARKLRTPGKIISVRKA